MRDLLPTDSLKERLSLPRLDSPVGNWQTDPVQACPSNLGDINLGLQPNAAKESIYGVIRREEDEWMVFGMGEGSRKWEYGGDLWM